MQILDLNERTFNSEEEKISKRYAHFKNLLLELQSQSITNQSIEAINSIISEINSSNFSGKELNSLLQKKLTILYRKLEKEFKIVPKNYYRNLWLSIGMSAIGLPIGVALGSAVDNMALLATGLPIGMGIGILIGMRLDKKALEEGRQLNIEYQC